MQVITTLEIRKACICMHKGKHATIRCNYFMTEKTNSTKDLSLFIICFFGLRLIQQPCRLAFLSRGPFFGDGCWVYNGWTCVVHLWYCINRPLLERSSSSSLVTDVSTKAWESYLEFVIRYPSSVGEVLILPLY